MPAQATINSTTQNFLDIYDITNDLVIMKDGTVSIILTVSAMNFGLLAEEEQDAIIYAYAALLNSLNYSIQIMIQSKTKDATAYLNLLKEQETKASTTQKRELISRYRQFLSELIRERNVLDKKFYVIVPASSLELGFIAPQSVVPGTSKFDITSIDRSLLLEKAKGTLEPKRDHLIGQFNRIGLYARQLQTQEIIQIFYNNYNPEASEGQQISNSKDYTTPLVQASITGGFMDNSKSQSTTPVVDPTAAATSAADTNTAAGATPAAPAVEPATSAASGVAEPVAGLKKPEDSTAPAVGATPAAPVTPATGATPDPAEGGDAQSAINDTLKDLPAAPATPATPAATDSGKNPAAAPPQLPEI